MFQDLGGLWALKFTALKCEDGERASSSCGTAGDRGDEKDAVAFLHGARFAAEEANVLFVEVDVEDLADLAAFVADVAGERGELAGERVESFGDGPGATGNFSRAVGETAECRWDFDCDGHC